MINLADLEIISYCQAVQELLDSSRFRKGFSDNILLKFKVTEIETQIKKLKNELLITSPSKFFPGYKIVIIDFLDRIIALVNSRFSNINLAKVKEIEAYCKDLMKKILNATSFEEIENYKEYFKRNIYLNVYELFLEYIKKR